MWAGRVRDEARGFCCDFEGGSGEGAGLFASREG